MEDLKNKILDRISPEPNTGCWFWMGACSGKGYGVANLNNASMCAHRLSYLVFVGPIPEGLQLDHKCRQRACVNPDHLEPVTSAENVRRASKQISIGVAAFHDKRRAIATCSRGHLFDGFWTNGKRIKRLCSQCNKIHALKRKEARPGK